MALLYYAVTQISINTNTSDMLSPDLPFRKNSNAFSKAFPQFSDNIVAVVDGPNADRVNEATDKLTIQLRLHPELFGQVFDPAGLDFFKQNGLLYLSEQKLATLSENLIAAQPFLGTLWKKPTLPGLFDLLSFFLKEGRSNQELFEATRPILDSISAVITAEANMTPKNLSWGSVIAGESADLHKQLTTRIIVIQPKTNFTSLQPGENSIDSLRKIGRQIKLQEKFGARLRLTGSVPLAEEELKSVTEGLGLAGILSLTLVFALLFWGLKSFRLVLATLITLLYGLVWTAGFATLVVGTLNLISVAFAVLFIGLSVDFGIHFVLKYLEYEETTPAALQAASKKIGRALGLSTVAAAIGFLSFLPTDYIGLAELGLIAGGGMFIAFFANLTLLPALISLIPPRQSQTTTSKSETSVFSLNHKLVIGFASLLAIASLFLLPKVEFDFDPLNLKNKKTESVATFFDLMTTGANNPYAITVLAKNLKTADIIASRARKLPLVQNTNTLSNLIPLKQDYKLTLIENLALILGPALTGPGNFSQSTEDERLRATVNLKNTISNFGEIVEHPTLNLTLQNFESAIDKLLTAANPNHALQRIEQRLFINFFKQMTQLKRSLNAEEIILKNIPPTLRFRQITKGGQAKVEISPKGNMRNREELLAFVKAVRLIAPKATGTPVIILEAGTTVIQSLVQAATLTIVLIALLVGTLTRSLRELILIFIPLICAVIFTLAASVILNLPFNFANVIVLPLLFGLGIAGSIHIVLRDRDQIDDTQNIMNTSTPRAVIFSALTTMGSFGSIALSSHPGTSSMGILLTIAITLSLVSTIVVLPALLTAWPKASVK